MGEQDDAAYLVSHVFGLLLDIMVSRKETLPKN